ncbi:hypothetical protein, partial [Priestia megaterium]|uniref:hypothetical protein n=1 Tax=Priestia megaterium TaxID=1404 RepID=UPI0035B5BAE1
SMYLWLIATEAVDRAMRELMYERYRPDEALRRLAKKYPGGSVKKELENRLANLDEEEANAMKSEDLLEQMADEC